VVGAVTEAVSSSDWAAHPAPVSTNNAITRPRTVWLNWLLARDLIDQIVGSPAPFGRAPLPERVTSAAVTSLSSLIDFVKSDLAKLIRFAAVSLVTVPLGMALFWVFLEVVDLQPAFANLVAVTLSTIPNYVLNRYWVWNKRGANSVRREIAPFWAIAFLGLLLSTALVALATRYTDESLAFLAVNFFAFGVLWVFKFFVLEKFLFATPQVEASS